MASVTITVAAGGEAGAVFRAIANAIETAVVAVPDRNATGASTVLTIDNAVGSVCGVQITAGPYTGTQVLV